MQFVSSSLQSKVARRIFWIFLSCAILPYALLIAVSYHQLENFFTDKSARQLRDLAKLFALDVHERLTLLDDNLRTIAASIAAKKNATQRSTTTGIVARQDQWNALALYDRAGVREWIFGNFEHGLNLTTQQKLHLAKGRGLLSIVPASLEHPFQIFMAVPLDRAHPDGTLLVGELNQSYLWGVAQTRLLPSYVRVCVQDQTGVRINCPDEISRSLPENLTRQLTTLASGDQEWRYDRRNYIASFWAVPMNYYFGVSAWTVLLQTTQEGTFASVEDLKTSFALSVLAAVSLSILLIFMQIRRRLVPVEKLKESTRRISEKDFEFRVDVRSGDEFEDLAASMNTMAGQLGRHFQNLSTRNEIDRAVLSLLETETIIETILSRSIATVSCDAARLTLFNAVQNETRLFVRSAADADIKRYSLPRVVATDVEKDGNPSQENRWPVHPWVVESHGPIQLGEAEIKNLELPFAAEEVRAILAAPLFAKEGLLGVLEFHSGRAGCFTEDDVRLLESLSGQASVAICNSQLFEQTNQQKTELEKANQAKDQFLAVMSHELRTPLNVMMGYLSLLEEKTLGDLTSEQTHALNIIDKHSKQLFGMIDNVMEATFLQTGRVSIRKEPMSPARMLERMEAAIRVPDGKTLVFSWHYNMQLPTLSTDEVKLKRILECLIDNALKFTAEGKVTIMAAYAPKLNAVQFTVRDTGIGIAPEAQGRIFEIFQQADNSGTRAFGGLGLGLYIVKQTADLIGATLELESEEEKGTTIAVTVPILDVSRDVGEASDNTTGNPRWLHPL